MPEGLRKYDPSRGVGDVTQDLGFFLDLKEGKIVEVQVIDPGSDVPLEDAVPGAPKWTRFNFVRNTLTCQRCFTESSVQLPMVNDVLVPTMSTFAAAHQNCPAPYKV